MIGVAHWSHAENWSLRLILNRTVRFAVYDHTPEGTPRVVYDGYDRATAYELADYEHRRGRLVTIRPRNAHDRWVQQRDGSVS